MGSQRAGCRAGLDDVVEHAARACGRAFDTLAGSSEHDVPLRRVAESVLDDRPALRAQLRHELALVLAQIGGLKLGLRFAKLKNEIITIELKLNAG
jgi:hypothetical protein